MKAKKWSYGSIGTVSEATMRPEDLIPAFVAELRYLGHRDKKLSIIERRAQAGESDPYWQDELSQWDLAALFDMLDEHALPYTYFGAHAGDGSDYGFWVYQDMEFDGLEVEDLSEIPSGYVGEVLHVNDHGNMTLYVKTARKLREVWSVV